jgi:hypothetical protein
MYSGVITVNSDILTFHSHSLFRRGMSSAHNDFKHGGGGYGVWGRLDLG